MSRTQDLLTAARKLSIKGVDKNTPESEILKKINAVLGTPDLGDDDLNRNVTASYASTIAKHGEESIATSTGAVTANAQNIPNLAPSGIWEGKRARLRRVKTGHNDMQGAIFNWNGYPCIIPIDTDVDIPWPIYEAILNCRGIEMEILQEDVPGQRGRVRNVKNITYYDKYPFQFKGATPGTEFLPESPWEYTLDMYVENFPAYTVRKWRQLCILWEISDKQAGIKTGISPQEEMEVRCNAIHYHLNLPLAKSKQRQDGVDLDMRVRIRNEKRSDIGMEARAA